MLHLCPLNTQIHWFHRLKSKYKFTPNGVNKIATFQWTISNTPFVAPTQTLQKDCKKSKCAERKKNPLALHHRNIEPHVCILPLFSVSCAEQRLCQTPLFHHMVHIAFCSPFITFLVFNCVNVVPGTVYLPCWFRLRLSET